ncbi:MAG: hypothetical protein Q8830_03335 [Candidatus Phytoplasma australasiaticum]|nr:hypothetical protein [Candidatus Phytoplasma australasiaticum]
MSHLIEEPDVVPSIEYVKDVDGKSNPTFDEESSQTFEGCEGLRFEEFVQPQDPAETTQPQQLIETTLLKQVGEIAQPQQPSKTTQSEQVGEIVQLQQPTETTQPQQPIETRQSEQPGEIAQPQQPVETSQPEETETFVDVGEGLGGSASAFASDVPSVESDWESETEAGEDSDYVDEDEEYDSDVHEEVRLLRKEKRATKIKK